MTSGDITFVLVLVAAVIYASASNDNVAPTPYEEAGTRDQVLVSSSQITLAIVWSVVLIVFALLPTKAIPKGWKWILIVAVAAAAIYVTARGDDSALPSDCEPVIRGGCSPPG